MVNRKIIFVNVVLEKIIKLNNVAYVIGKNQQIKLANDL